MRPSTAMRGLPLAIGMPPLDESRRDHREDEIDAREDPQRAPVARHLPQARAQLVDADHAIDREIRREDITCRLHRLGDRLARPGETPPKKLRKTGGEKNKGGGVR